MKKAIKATLLVTIAIGVGVGTVYATATFDWVPNTGTKSFLYGTQIDFWKNSGFADLTIDTIQGQSYANRATIYVSDLKALMLTDPGTPVSGGELHEHTDRAEIGVGRVSASDDSADAWMQSDPGVAGTKASVRVRSDGDVIITLGS